jgi:hypothetical protein
MAQAPWFKFYAADYMSSPFVQSLDPEYELWYLRLIIASAINLPRGCLPLANGKLWRLAKAPNEEYFEKHAGPILAKFERDEAAGVYRVPKVASQQLLTPAALSIQRSKAGKRGAAKRWQSAMSNDGKVPSKPTPDAKQKIADSDSDSDSEKHSSSEQKSSSDPVVSASVGKTREEPSTEASKVAQLLKAEILRNRPDYRITAAQERQWAAAADRMIRLDGCNSEKIAELICWAQRDEFWRSNVLSMNTLREKFDQLSLKAQLSRSSRSAEKSALVKLPPDYVSASEQIRQVRSEQGRAQ